MADVAHSPIKTESDYSSSSSSEDESHDDKKEEKQKKRRREWKEKVLQMAILKYILTSLNVPLCIHGTDIPQTTYKEKLSDYMVLIEEHRKETPQNNSEECLTVESDRDNENDVSQESEATKSSRNLSDKRSRIQQMCKVLLEAKDLPDPKNVNEQEIQDILDNYDFPPFPMLKKMGHATVFHYQEEEDMMVYLSEMSDLGMPRTMQEFQTDVKLYYLFKTEDEEDVKDYVFSKSWCKCFRHDHCPTFKFSTRTQADKVKNNTVDSNRWQEQIKTKILDMNDNHLISASDNIFLIESQTLSLDKDGEEVKDPRQIKLMVAYNAAGFMLRPLIIRNGKVSEKTRTKYEEKFMFHSVDPPQVNKACLLMMKDEIQRHASKMQLEYPIVIYLSPDTAEGFGYVMWDFCKDNFVIVLPIPSSVYATFTESKHGVCGRIQDEWHIEKTLKHISQEEEIAFLECYVILKKIWNRLKIKTKLMQTFTEFKLKLVQHKTRKRKSTIQEDTSQCAKKANTDMHLQDQQTQNHDDEGPYNVLVDSEENPQATEVKQEVLNNDLPTADNEIVTSITCSNCNIVLELTEDILNEMILSNSEKFDQLMLNKVKENLHTLQRETKSQSIQCQLIGNSLMKNSESS